MTDRNNGKNCSRCKVFKKINEFSIDKTKRDGRSYICKECKRNVNKRRYQLKIGSQIQNDPKRQIKLDMRIVHGKMCKADPCDIVIMTRLFETLCELHSKLESDDNDVIIPRKIYDDDDPYKIDSNTMKTYAWNICATTLKTSIQIQDIRVDETKISWIVRCDEFKNFSEDQLTILKDNMEKL